MTAGIRTIARIVRLRSTTPKTQRPVRPAPLPAGGLPAREPTPHAAPQRTRRRPSGRVLALVAFVAVLLAGAVAAIVLTMPRMERLDERSLTRDASPTFVLRVAHPGSLAASQVEAMIDGDAVEASRITVEGARIELRAPRLDDGEHTVLVRARRVGLIRTTLDERFSVRVDTTAPAARVIAPLGVAAADANEYVAAGVVEVTKLPMRITVGAEPGSRLDISSAADGAQGATAKPSEDTRRTVELDLPQGAQQLRIVATDAAGNETVRTMRVLVDTAGPAVSVRVPRLVKDATLALPIAVRDTHGATLTVKLDGVKLEDAVSVGDATDAPFAAAAGDEEQELDAEAGDTVEGAEGPAPTAPVAVRGKVLVEDGAMEGRHTLEVTAVDTLGNRSTFTRMFVVDSTEQLGQAAGLRAGARGGDVAQLHAALLEQEVVGEAAIAADLAARAYGAQTRAAVRRFQTREGMSVDGIAGSDTVAGLTLKIVIDRGAHTLTLYRVGAVVKQWGIAVGSPEYPTPAGDFEIQTMQKNPTWTPPDSEWAKDAEVTPPGPDNPLGTRWMAINGTVGIHGTNSPQSIGYSVSHGCIRMAIPHVEELFDMVAIGTRVTVV